MAPRKPGTLRVLADHREDNPHRRVLVRELVASNDREGPPEGWQFVGFYALDDGGELAGGIQGNFEWDWLHITHLWVRERGRGLGRQLVEAAEDFARQHEKRGLLLVLLCQEHEGSFGINGLRPMGRSNARP